MRRALLLVVVAAAMCVVVPEADASELVVTDGCVASVPEPGSSDPVAICFTLFRPAGASAEHPVPMVLHSHGWGQGRQRSAAIFDEWFEAGFAVLSFDQRGFGESGGSAHMQHPDVEGQDVQRLVDLVAGLDWVAQEAPGDPVLGAIGGSYGGAYQFAGALTELRDRGATRFDVLAPETTWWDLRQSLAPQGVVRTAWLAALAALGVDANADAVNEAFASSAVTGEWPADVDSALRQTGPHWHATEGRLLDIPVLLGQGTNDTLVNLNQGLANFDHALTPAARAASIFVGTANGHGLPSTYPAGTGVGPGDPCSAALLGGAGSFDDLARAFFAEELLGVDAGPDLGFARGSYHIATAEGRCASVASVEPDLDVLAADVVVTAGAEGPAQVQLLDGPRTVAGRPLLDVDVTTSTYDARLFLALSVGPSADQARVVQYDMLPLREVMPVVDAHRVVELPAVAVDVPAGHHLYLTVSGVSDQSFGHGSRLPGQVRLTRPIVHLPIAA